MALTLRCELGNSGRISPKSTFSSRPQLRLAQVCRCLIQASTRTLVGGLGASQEARFRRLLEYLGNSRLTPHKPVVTHRTELRGKGFNSQVGGDFPYVK